MHRNDSNHRRPVGASVGKKPQWTLAGEHFSKANHFITEARSLLTDSLSAIGIDIEAHWQQILEKSPNDKEYLETMATRGGFKEGIFKRDMVYMELVNADNAPFRSIEDLFNMGNNEPLQKLHPAITPNPFAALERGDTEAARTFCQDAQGNGGSVPGFDKNPKRVVAEAAGALLAKYQQAIDAETMHAIPDTITRKLREASHEIGEAIACMKKESQVRGTPGAGAGRAEEA